MIIIFNEIFFFCYSEKINQNYNSFENPKIVSSLFFHTPISQSEKKYRWHAHASMLSIMLVVKILEIVKYSNFCKLSDSTSTG